MADREGERIYQRKSLVGWFILSAAVLGIAGYKAGVSVGKPFYGALLGATAGLCFVAVSELQASGVDLWDA